MSLQGLFSAPKIRMLAKRETRMPTPPGVSCACEWCDRDTPRQELLVSTGSACRVTASPKLHLSLKIGILNLLEIQWLKAISNAGHGFSPWSQN